MSTKLELLKGIVCELAIERGEEDFLRGNADRTLSAATATALAAAGLAGAATGALLATTGGGDSVEFFACTVDGKRLAGRFTKASFKDGDAVEVAVEAQADGTYAALAVRRPSDQTVWMFPHCSRGSTKHLMYACKMALSTLIFLLTLFFIFYGSIVIFSNEKYPVNFLWFTAMVSGFLSLVMACYFSIRVALRWRPFVQKAEAIFTVFGYRDPSRVDMEQQHKKYLRQHGGKWPYLVEALWVFRYADAS